MLNLFSKARIYVGLSKSDGISTSMLEAMALGAFPIQTDTSCASEWIFSSAGGFIVDYQKEVSVRDSLIEALENDLLVDTAQKSNRDKILQNYTVKYMETQVKALYRQILALTGGADERAR
jgi:glycosyltransferase involved in cell wall biosynthesis